MVHSYPERYNMFIAVLCAFLIVAAIVIITLAFRCRTLQKWLIKSIEAGEELQNNANANDIALRQGLEDQREVYEQEFLGYLERDAHLSEIFREDSDEFEQDITALLSMNTLLSERCEREIRLKQDLRRNVDTLLMEHQFHKDHCLPVLNHMRKAINV